MWKKLKLFLSNGEEITAWYNEARSEYTDVPQPGYTYRYELISDPLTGRIDAVCNKAYCNYCGDVFTDIPLRVQRFRWVDIVKVLPAA